MCRASVAFEFDEGCSALSTNCVSLNWPNEGLLPVTRAARAVEAVAIVADGLRLSPWQAHLLFFGVERRALVLRILCVYHATLSEPGNSFISPLYSSFLFTLV